MLNIFIKGCFYKNTLFKNKIYKMELINQIDKTILFEKKRN